MITKGTAPVESAPTRRELPTESAPTNGRDDRMKTSWKERDFEAEAHGKVACASYGAALMSPGLAVASYATTDEYLAAVRKAADEMVKYTWEKQK